MLLFLKLSFHHHKHSLKLHSKLMVNHLLMILKINFHKKFQVLMLLIIRKDSLNHNGNYHNFEMKIN
jgi:hypothetical protein